MKIQDRLIISMTFLFSFFSLLNIAHFFVAGQAFPCAGLTRYTKLGDPDELILNEDYAKELLGDSTFITFSRMLPISNTFLTIKLYCLYCRKQQRNITVSVSFEIQSPFHYFILQFLQCYILFVLFIFGKF